MYDEVQRDYDKKDLISMNVLFLTIGRMESIEAHSLYPDLLRQFCRNGHSVYVVSPYERRVGKETSYDKENGVHMLRVKIGNLTKCNIIEKGISTLRIESQFKSAIKKYFANVKFDLVLYSTPPITLAGVVKFIKKRDNASTYLLLKDIFPQNAVDIGMMSKTGIKGLLYRHFRKKEKQLYALSDRIGCMSRANCEFVVKHNCDVNPEKVEICPNAIEIRDMSLTLEERFSIREKYGIPHDKTVFVYGGNLGKPQGITFFIECLKTQLHNEKAFFLVVGDGTEYSKIQSFFEQEQPSNMKLMKRLLKEDYDRMVAACDVGMIFLDHRFTIPNFPSRLLAYMQAGLPVLACTDPNTDIGKVIVEGGFGLWCESNDVNVFCEQIEVIMNTDRALMQQQEKMYLHKHYNVEKAYCTIMKIEYDEKAYCKI